MVRLSTAVVLTILNISLGLAAPRFKLGEVTQFHNVSSVRPGSDGTLLGRLYDANNVFKTIRYDRNGQYTDYRQKYGLADVEVGIGRSSISYLSAVRFKDPTQDRFDLAWYEQDGRLKTFRTPGYAYMTSSGSFGDKYVFAKAIREAGRREYDAVLYDTQTGEQVVFTGPGYFQVSSMNSRGQVILTSNVDDNDPFGWFAWIYENDQLSLLKTPGGTRKAHRTSNITSDGRLIASDIRNFYIGDTKGNWKKILTFTEQEGEAVYSELSDVGLGLVQGGRPDSNGALPYRIVHNEQVYDPSSLIIDGLQSGEKFNPYTMDTETGRIYGYITKNGQFPTPYRTHYIDIVPEPGTLAALGLGVAALARRRRGA